MLADLLNKDVLVELAGERAFERGADYFADGLVVGVKEENGTITARVRGTYYYRVKVWAEDEELCLLGAQSDDDLLSVATHPARSANVLCDRLAQWQESLRVSLTV